MKDLYQKCRELSQENQEIPILRDSLEEMKYLQSKVVGVVCNFVNSHALPELDFLWVKDLHVHVLYSGKHSRGSIFMGRRSCNISRFRRARSCCYIYVQTCLFHGSTFRDS